MANPVLMLALPDFFLLGRMGRLMWKNYSDQW